MASCRAASIAFNIKNVLAVLDGASALAQRTMSEAKRLIESGTSSAWFWQGFEMAVSFVDACARTPIHNDYNHKNDHGAGAEASGWHGYQDDRRLVENQWPAGDRS